MVVRTALAKFLVGFGACRLWVLGVSASPVSQAVILWCVASACSSPRINLAVTPRSPSVVVACPPWAALPLTFRYRVRFLIVSILILVGDDRCSTGVSVLSLYMYSTLVLRHSLRCSKAAFVHPKPSMMSPPTPFSASTGSVKREKTSPAHSL